MSLSRESLHRGAGSSHVTSGTSLLCLICVEFGGHLDERFLGREGVMDWRTLLAFSTSSAQDEKNGVGLGSWVVTSSSNLDGTLGPANDGDYGGGGGRSRWVPRDGC